MESNTPVLLIVFNRPSLTKSILSSLKVAKIKRLFIASDGPRKGNLKDEEACSEIDTLISDIDWVNDLHVLKQTSNLGCGKAVSAAIDWFFTNNQRGIILEDDCLPSSSFFSYCDNALNQFENNSSVWHIDGSNFSSSLSNNLYTYSRFPLIWGWATWKSRWEKYSFNYEREQASNIISTYFQDQIQKRYWINRLNDFYASKVDTWDYQWMLTIWKYGGHVVRPPRNLIKNIGFSGDGTHTTSASQKKLSIEQEDISIDNYTINTEEVIDDKIDYKQFLNRFMKGSQFYSFLFYINDNYFKKY